jgi:O-antigen/teichoic acid export membrane protein
MTHAVETLSPVVPVTTGTAVHASLRRNFAWMLAGNVTYAACQWGMLVAIARLGTPGMVGEFALGLAVSAPVFMLTSLQLRVVLATDARDEYRLGDYLALRLLGTVLGLAAIAAFVAVAGFRRETAAVVLLVSAAKACEAQSDTLYGYWQKHERFEKIARALVGRGIGSLAAMAGVLYLTGSVVWGAAVMALVWAVWLATYERSGAAAVLAGAAGGERLRAEWHAGKLKRLAALTVPLGFVTMLISLNANIPRYFVEHDLGEAALGYFAAMAYVFVAGNTVMAAVAQSAVPRLARAFHEDRAAFVRLLRNMVLLGAGVGAAGIGVAVLAGQALLRLLYGGDYARYAGVFVWLMVAGALAYVTSMLGYGLTAARLFRQPVPLYLAATVVTVLACWMLVPRFGLMGSAWAVLIGAAFSGLGCAYILLSALRSGRLDGVPGPNNSRKVTGLP